MPFSFLLWWLLEARNKLEYQVGHQAQPLVLTATAAAAAAAANLCQMNRGVARRRPQGPGLNLKMLKNNPKNADQFYPKFHIVMFNIVTLRLYYWPAPEALIQALSYFRYLCLLMYIWCDVNNWLNDHVSVILSSDESTIWWLSTLELLNIFLIEEEIRQHQAWY